MQNGSRPRTELEPDGRLRTSCSHCGLRKCRRTRDFTDEQLAAVEWFKVGEAEFQAGADILTARSESAHLYTLYEGLAFRHISLPDGRRQILNFLFPGDFIGLQGSVFAASKHQVSTLTDSRVCVFEKKNLTELFRRVPELGYDITWLAAQEESFVDLNLLAVGKYRADQRIAYLLMFYFERMRALDLVDGPSCVCPLKQHHIADSLGLSLPYTNAAMRKLTSDEILRLEAGRLHILDWERFADRAVVTARYYDRIPFI